MSDQLGSAVLVLKTDDRAYNEGLRRAEGTATSWGGRVSSAGKAAAFAMAGVGAAATGIIGALSASAISVAHHAGEVEKLKRELGVTAEEASRLSAVGQRLGLDTDALSLSFGKFSKFVIDSSDKLAEHGISVARTRDGHVDFEKTLGGVADRFKAMPDGVEKSALAMELFGKSGKDMIPLLNKGRDGLKEMGDEAARMGLVFDDKALASAKRLRDAQKDLREAFEGAKNSIGLAFLPVLANVATSFSSLAKEHLPGVISKIGDVKQFLESKLAPAWQAASEKAGAAKDLFIAAVNFIRPGADEPEGLKLAEAFKRLFGTEIPEAALRMGEQVARAFQGIVSTAGHVIGGVGEIFDVLTGRRPDAGGELAAALGDELATSIMQTVAGVRDTAKTATGEIGDLIGKMWELAQPKIEAFVRKLDDLKDRFEKLPDPLRNFIGAVAIAGVATKATGLDDTLGNIANGLGNMIGGITGVLAVAQGPGGLSAALGGLGLAARGALLAIAGFALPALAIGGIITGLIFIATHTQELGEAWTALSGIVGVVAGFVGRRIGDLFDLIGTKIHEFFEPFGRLIELFAKDAPYALGILVGAVLRATGAMWSAIGTFIHNWFEGMGRLKDFVLSKFGELKDGAVDAVKGLATGAWDALSHFVTVDVPQFLGDLKDQLLGTGGGGKGLPDLAKDAVAGFVQGIIDAIPGAVAAAASFIGDFIQGMKDALGNPRSPAPALIPLGLSIAEGLAAGVESGTGLLGAAAAKLVNFMTLSLKDQIAVVLANFKNTAGNFVLGPGNAVPTVAGNINLPGFGGMTLAQQIANAPAAGINQVIGGTLFGLSAAAISRGGIPRFHHGGVAPDEMLAILQRGETVISRGGAIEVPVYLDGRLIARATGRYTQQDTRLAGKPR